jgi:hypothetical protein
VVFIISPLHKDSHIVATSQLPTLKNKHFQEARLVWNITLVMKTLRPFTIALLQNALHDFMITFENVPRYDLQIGGFALATDYPAELN